MDGARHKGVCAGALLWRSATGRVMDDVRSQEGDFVWRRASQTGKGVEEFGGWMTLVSFSRKETRSVNEIKLKLGICVHQNIQCSRKMCKRLEQELLQRSSQYVAVNEGAHPRKSPGKCKLALQKATTVHLTVAEVHLAKLWSGGSSGPADGMGVSTTFGKLAVSTHGQHRHLVTQHFKCSRAPEFTFRNVYP